MNPEGGVQSGACEQEPAHAPGGRVARLTQPVSHAQTAAGAGSHEAVTQQGAR